MYTVAGYLTIMKILFKTLGPPKHQQRHRHVTTGKFTRTYDPSAKDKKDFLLQAMQYKPKSPILGEVKLTVWFCMPRPKSHYRTGKFAGMLKPSVPIRHTKKPDIDNCAKFVMDSLNGVFWKDDSQICQIIAYKFYDEKPRVVIEINY